MTEHGICGEHHGMENVVYTENHGIKGSYENPQLTLYSSVKV